MRIVDYLDKGASLGPERPCLTMAGASLSYADVQRRTYNVARALARDGIAVGQHVAILSDNDPVSFTCVLALSRAGLVWCPINPRNEVSENAHVLDLFDCAALFFQANFTDLVAAMRPSLPRLTLYICIDGVTDFAPSLAEWMLSADNTPTDIAPAGPLAMIAGTGGTTGSPKGVMLTDANLEAMTALTLIGFPFRGRPVYLAMAPLTHAAGVLTFPIFALGGEVVIMPKADLGAFLDLLARHRVTHTFLPPTLIYMLLDDAQLATTDLSSLQCFWYGAAPMSTARLTEALVRIGPVMAQFFGQTEAPMMISMLPPDEHFLADGTIAIGRLASAGRPGPLVQVATADPAGNLLPRGETGEIVVRGALVMAGYYKNPAATAEADANGWHRTGDIGFIDADDYLFIVDRAKDMIISGGFNVYSAEVEQALAVHPAVRDSAVVGLPDAKWGERVCAVVELRPGVTATAAEILLATKALIGSIKAPKQIYIWPDLPRSKVGKVLKREIRQSLLSQEPLGAK